MIILHTAIHNDVVNFWAEVSNDTNTKNKLKKDTDEYKLSASPKQLSQILASIGINAKNTTSKWIALPTSFDGNNSIPSNDLILGDIEQTKSDEESTTKKTNEKAYLKKWKINVIELDGNDSIALLSHIMGKRIVQQGTLVGTDMAYLAELMRFAGSLTARQQYLPDVIKDDTMHKAVWSPIVTGRDGKRLKDMLKRLPDTIRAVSTYNTTTAKIPRKTTNTLLNMLTLFTDSIVRTSIPNHITPTSQYIKNFDSIHDAWIHHLTTNKINKIKDAIQLRTQIQEWRRPITTYADSPVQLCFRLEEPPTPRDEWYVRYMIRSRDDPSLIINADKAWDEDTTTLLPKSVNIKEFLLGSLGRSAGIFPSISKGLESKKKSSNSMHGISGCHISLETAHSFLTKESIALEQSGYVVMYPSWWAGKGAKIRVSADVKPPVLKAQGMLTLNTIVEFDWQIAIGNQNITVQELQRLADAKAPLVNVRGTWVEMSQDDIKDAIKLVKNKAKRSTMTLLDAIKMNLNGSMDATKNNNNNSNDASTTTKPTTGTLEVNITSSDDQISKILNQLSNKTQLEKQVQPRGFIGKLRPYQLRGFSWLSFLQQWGLGGCLADDMGLGKTIQILALAQKYIQKSSDQKDKSPFLLVCPTSVITNWQKESARFTPDITTIAHHGLYRAKTKSAFVKKIKGCDMVITSYGLMQRDIKIINAVKWSVVVLDEAQNIKNAETKQAKATRTIEADCKFALTGTPVENNVGDLWSIMEFLNPGFLGTLSAFKRNFFLPIQVKQDQMAAERLKRATGPFILRRLKTDKKIITDLPEKMESKTYCTLTKEQATLYAAVIKEIEDALAVNDQGKTVSSMRRRGIILSALAKLKQICDHPRILLKDNSSILTNSEKSRSGKLARLTEMLSEIIEVGDSVLVFTQFVEMGHILQRHIQESFGREVMFLHGGTSRKKRDEMVEKFQDKKKNSGSKIFVISLKAGGTGLNLTAANHVFHFDRWWNPAVEDQATDRAFRIGQKKKVQVYKMICSGTLEEKIDHMIERKKEVSRKVVGTGEGWITEMSNEDLRDVLSLSAEASGSEIEEGDDDV